MELAQVAPFYGNMNTVEDAETYQIGPGLVFVDDLGDCDEEDTTTEGDDALIVPNENVTDHLDKTNQDGVLSADGLRTDKGSAGNGEPCVQGLGKGSTVEIVRSRSVGELPLPHRAETRTSANECDIPWVRTNGNLEAHQSELSKLQSQTDFLDVNNEDIPAPLMQYPSLVMTDQSFDVLPNHSETNVIEPIMIVPEAGYESDGSVNNGFPTVRDTCDDTNLCLPNDVQSLNIQPLVIEPLSEDSDQDDETGGESSTQSKHPKRKLFRCVKCKKKFRSPVDLLKHKELHCKKKRHQDGRVKLPQFTCLKCNYRSNGRIPLTTCILHTKIHDKLKYSCQDCDVRFKWWNSVLRHWKDYHKPLDEACPEPELEPSAAEDSQSDVIQQNDRFGSTEQHMQQNDRFGSTEQHAQQNDRFGSTEQHAQEIVRFGNTKKFTQRTVYDNAECNQQNDNDEYFCSKCSLSYKTVQLFCNHLRRCWHFCKCGNTSKNVRGALRHAKYCAASGWDGVWYRKGVEQVTPWSIPCPACPYSAYREELLVKHLQESNWHEGVQVASLEYQKKFAYMCPICLEYIFKSPYSKELVLDLVINHMKMYHMLSAKCHFCYRSHPVADLDYHIERDHREMPTRSCLYCCRIFLTVKATIRHMRFHDLCRYICTKCLWAYENPSLLSHHSATNHSNPNPDVMCDVCEFKTQYMAEGMEHHKQHQWFKEKCPECPMQFLTEAYLKKHMNKHMVIDPRNEAQGSVQLVMSGESENTAFWPTWWDPARRTHILRTPANSLAARKTSMSESWKCFLCVGYYQTCRSLVDHLLRIHGNCHISTCNSRTTVFAHSDGFALYTKCLGCKACPYKEVQYRQIFSSIKEFDKHCAVHSTWNIDEIKCLIAHCSYIAQGEVQYYRHLAKIHKDTVKITVYLDSLHITHKKGPVKVHLGLRHSCIFCKRIFFTREALRSHMLKNRLTNKDHRRGLPFVDLLFTQQHLPDDIMALLRESPLVTKMMNLYRFATNKNRKQKVLLNNVCISEGYFSSGRQNLIRNHDPESLEETGTCSRCEQLLQVQIPPDICLAQRQPLVTLHRDDLKKYMLNYALNSGQPIPKWYRQHYEEYTVTVSMMAPGRKPQKTERRNKVVVVTPIWSKHCRKCYSLFDVLVLHAECVHKRYVIVSLVNADDQALNHTSTPRLNGVKTETSDNVTTHQAHASRAQSGSSTCIVID